MSRSMEFDRDAMMNLGNKNKDKMRLIVGTGNMYKKSG